VLPGEVGFVFHEGKAEGFEFEDGLLGGHFVEGFDGDIGIFGAEFQKVDDTAGFEGGVEGLKHFGGVGEFVVGIYE